ncbi:hypothetical protein BDQ17DRAFT_1432015 [Cyathus striatus]|nr:hypothetical protein BDQ17DRAFT_1432015 [Cyathus striatus]
MLPIPPHDGSPQAKPRTRRTRRKVVEPQEFPPMIMEPSGTPTRSKGPELDSDDLMLRLRRLDYSPLDKQRNKVEAGTSVKKNKVNAASSTHAEDSIPLYKGQIYIDETASDAVRKSIIAEASGKKKLVEPRRIQPSKLPRPIQKVRAAPARSNLKVNDSKKKEPSRTGKGDDKPINSKPTQHLIPLKIPKEFGSPRPRDRFLTEEEEEFLRTSKPDIWDELVDLVRGLHITSS